MTDRAAQLRQQILELAAEYFNEAFSAAEFQPGQSSVPVSGKLIDAADMSSVVDSALDGWFTTGRFAEEFERKLARFVGVRSASLVNSGSSANLVAVSALTSPKLGDRRLKPGDEVITVAAGFPTTPTRDPQVRLVFQGIRRTLGTAPAQKNAAITAEVRAMVETLSPASLIGMRDRALLLVGFAGAFRRSELVSLDVADIAFNSDGLVVQLRRSKTDQEGEG